MFINLLMTIKSLLSFTFIIFVLRIFTRASYFFKVPVKAASTPGPHFLLLNLLLLLSLVKESPYINGTIFSDIQPLRWSTAFCPSITFLCCLTSHLFSFVLPVNKENCTNFILVPLNLLPVSLWNFCFLMYGVLPLFCLSIINVISFALWMILASIFGFSLLLKNLMFLLLSLNLNPWLKTSLIDPLNPFKLMEGENSLSYKNSSPLMASLIAKHASTPPIKMAVLSVNTVKLWTLALPSLLTLMFHLSIGTQPLKPPTS